MISIIKNFVCGLIAIFACTGISYAADMLGNPTDIGSPGQIELLAGGGKSSNLALEAQKTTGHLQIGTLSASYSVPATPGSFDDDQIFFGMSYALNTKTQLFANLGSGKSNEGSTSTRTIGLKLSPQSEASEMKMGVLLRAQQVTMDMQGPFNLSSSYNHINDGTNTSYLMSALNGSEQIKYNRMDAFVGASRGTGTFRPYGGFCLTRISGTDSISLSDTVNVVTQPNVGGASTNTTQQVSFNAKSDISSRKNFTAVLGLSLNPNNDIGIVTEYQFGLQTSFSMSGNFRF